MKPGRHARRAAGSAPPPPPVRVLPDCAFYFSRPRHRGGNGFPAIDPVGAAHCSGRVANVSAGGVPGWRPGGPVGSREPHAPSPRATRKHSAYSHTPTAPHTAMTQATRGTVPQRDPHLHWQCSLSGVRRCGRRRNRSNTTSSHASLPTSNRNLAHIKPLSLCILLRAP